MRHRLLAVGLLASLAAGCATERPAGPDDTELAPSTLADSRSSPHRITVLSRNLYIGADVDRVIGALATPDPADDLPALLGALAVVEATDFPSRARAIAREVARLRPHVIGLQEVSQLDIDLTPLGIPAPIIHQDFLAILQQALADRGLAYEVAAKVQNTTAAPLPGVSLVDYDVLLFDQRRARLDAVLAARPYQQNIGTVAPGITIIRGYVAAVFTVGREQYTVLATHLESGGAAGLDLLRAAQASEIATVLGTAGPAVLLGDFNDIPGSPMHQVLSAAGFRDVWAELRPGVAGFTCCHAEDLSNRKAEFTQRIDYVWSRGIGRRNGDPLGQVIRLGLRPHERIRGPAHRLWPSDHAGIGATLFSTGH